MKTSNNIPKDNFYQLVVDGYDKFYYYLNQAERNMYLNYKDTGTMFRSFLEAFISMILEKEHMKIDGSLNEKIKSVIKIDKYASVLNDDKKIKYKTIGGKETWRSRIDFLRLISNVASHENPTDQSLPKLNYDNLSKALRCYFEILKIYFEWPAKIKYNPNRFYIGEYLINEVHNGSEYDRTEIVKECKGYLYNNGMIQKYFLIDIFKKSAVQENLMKHSSDAYEAADSSSPYGVRGISKVYELSKHNDAASPEEYYLIAYEFKREFCPLDEYIKSHQLNKKQKLEICIKLTESLKQLHSTGIYHRLLNHSNVYICEFNTALEPVIAHFSFAKIDNEYWNYTVLDNLNKKQKNSQLKYMKYVCQFISDYAKVDIYSLGVLFYCILTEDFDGLHMSDRNLKKIVSNDFYEEILRMIKTSERDREDDLDMVVLTLEEELKHV